MSKEKEYEFKTHNKQGEINYNRYNKILIWLFLALIFPTFLAITYYETSLANFDLFKNTENFFKGLGIEFGFIWDRRLSYSMTYILFIIPFIISLINASLYLKRVKKKAKIQQVLSSVGLSQYSLHKMNLKKREYTFRLEKGGKIAYENFQKNAENFCQLFAYPSMKSSRQANEDVFIQFQDKFPEIEELKDLEIKDFMKKGELLVGFGVPSIGEDIPKEELIKDRFISRYVSFKDLAVGTANLGSAGGGKSVSMSQYLNSIFYNFDLIADFGFVDFKGGIESEPLKRMEDRLKTGKITVYDDNRLALYKALKRYDLMNKARMKYLKDNKLKKFVKDLIFLIFDELAEILDYEAQTKEEKKMQSEIKAILESLLRTGRSQGFRIFYSTQSYLATSSGLTSGMKNNTKLKIAHQLGSAMQVGSIKPVEEIRELGLTSPTDFDIGRNLVINEQTNDIYEVRSLYVPDNFTETIEIEKTEPNYELEEAMQDSYKAIYQKMKEDKKALQIDDKDDPYTLDELAKDMGILSESEIKKPVEPTIEEKVNATTPVEKPFVKEEKQARPKLKLLMPPKRQKKKLEEATEDEVKSFMNVEKDYDENLAKVENFDNEEQEIDNLITEIEDKTPEEVKQNILDSEDLVLD